MNTETIKGDWTETKAKIKARWGKFTDDSIESLKGNMEQLSGKLQHLYGYAKEQADREYTEFKASLHATEPAKKPVVEEVKTPSAPESKKVAENGTSIRNRRRAREGGSISFPDRRHRP